MSVTWENAKDYDIQLISGAKYYTASVTDGEGNAVALVYGRTKQECATRADAIACVPQTPLVSVDDRMCSNCGRTYGKHFGEECTSKGGKGTFTMELAHEDLV